VTDELGGGGLSEVALGQSANTRFGMPKSRGGQDFRALDSGEGSLPPSLDNWLPTEHLAPFVAESVDVHVDLVSIRPAYDARVRNGASTRQVMRYMRSETERVLAEKVRTLLTETRIDR
jgi:hypothetical protein